MADGRGGFLRSFPCGRFLPISSIRLRDRREGDESLPDPRHEKDTLRDRRSPFYLHPVRRQTSAADYQEAKDPSPSSAGVGPGVRKEKSPESQRRPCFPGMFVIPSGAFYSGSRHKLGSTPRQSVPSPRIPPAELLTSPSRLLCGATFGSLSQPFPRLGIHYYRRPITNTQRFFPTIALLSASLHPVYPLGSSDSSPGILKGKNHGLCVKCIQVCIETVPNCD